MSTTTAPVLERAELAIEGMSCAGCATRVERSLNRLDGVDATVNYATAVACVAYDPGRVAVADVVREVERAGYGAHSADAVVVEAPEGSAARLAVAAALTVPVALLGMVSGIRFEGWEWVALALTTPVVAWCGLPFHRGALAGLRHRTATMDTLVSLGTLAAFSWSVTVLFAGLEAETYFETAAVITTLILLGRWLEDRAKRRSGAAIRSMLELGAKDARVLRDGAEVVVAVDAVVPGDVFVVRPGERIATDGVVVDGRAAVDASILTGEPVPVEAGPGAAVAGGTIATDGRIVVRATAVGADTALARIARLVADAQTGKAPVQRLADRVSGVFVPFVLGVAVVTLVGWLALTGDAADAFTAAVAVLIIACPCALGLATPTALMVGTGRGAQLGIVIRGPEVLERARTITTAALDKTGTLTTGKLAVADVVADGMTPSEVLRLAGAAEDASEHPIAAAIADRARAEVWPLPVAQAFASSAGVGVEAVVEGRRVLVGRPAFLAERGVALGAATEAAVAAAEERGRTGVAVAVDGKARGVIEVADTVKATSRDAVEELRALEIEPVLLTGDNERAARAVARELGIERVRAGLLPADKIDVVRELRAAGEVVAMVGDGVNDAPALVEADLGIALGTGTDIAIEASDLTLVSGDPRAAADAVRLARRTLATIRGNLFWAFAYNVAAIPLAVAGLLDPMIAAAAMAFSSIFVISNSLRLRRFRSVRT
jgi:P-type Cu+ transporter